MKPDGTSGVGWSDCRQNQKEKKRARVRRMARVARPAIRDAIAPDGQG